MSLEIAKKNEDSHSPNTLHQILCDEGLKWHLYDHNQPEVNVFTDSAYSRRKH